MFWIFGAGAALELLLAAVRPLWRWREGWAICATGLTALGTGGIAGWRPNVFSVLLLFVTLYRVFNMTRIIERRMHDAYLHFSTRRTTLTLLAVQLVLGLAWWAWHRWEPHGPAAWVVLAGAQLVLAVILLASTLRRLKHTRWPGHNGHLPDSELPTVTVAIPARNETEDLNECLGQIIQNDYPKLEIIVLDDCSQTRRTSEIIRGFAHDGVRFVQGEEPSDTWLPKNQAYHRLAHEASGQYILFCGVDVRFGPQSIRQIVNQMLSHKKEMVTILPWRLAGAGSALAQSLRYWWELVPPRRLFQRPPVLSTCWIIERRALEADGGFRAVARSITPEAHFAKAAARRDAYSFVRASQASDIASIKAPAEQRGTTVRTRYPQLHRRPENVMALALGELAFLILPFVLAGCGWWMGIGWVAQALAAAASIALIITYEKLALATRTGTFWLSLVALPEGMLYDVWLAHRSMWQYEFSTVEWKGRNICVPAMHVIPHLPKIDR